MPSPVPFSGKDYTSIRQALLDRIPTLTDRWTDHSPSDLGIVLLELFAGVGDMLATYLDAQAAEAYLPTVRKRQNLANLCKLLGYRLDRPVPTTTVLRFSVETPLAADLRIPEGTLCRAVFPDGEVPFQTATAGLLSRGDFSVDIPARQGKPHTESFTATGEAWQEYRLYATDLALAPIQVAINGEPWVEVAHFQESAADSPHFLSETDGEDKTTLRFGDGRRGKIPPNGEPIEVAYTRTLGAKGNLGPNQVTEVRTPIYLGDTLISLNVTNLVPATGGADRETLEHARAQAPAELRTLWKAVTKQDYQTLAEGFPGIAKARVLDIDDIPTAHYYQVNLVVAPAGGGPPSPSLLAELTEFLETRKTITTEIRLFAPDYRPVAVDAEVFIFPGGDPATVRNRLEAALAAHFDFARVGFGQSVYHSDLVALIDNTTGVSHVHMHVPAGDVTVGPGQIPILGEVQLLIREVGA